jgi:transcriptional regulator with XRE-family HTH domain
MDASSYAVKQLVQVLKDARLARGLSQRELAEQAGLGQNRLAKIEAGTVDIRTSTLVQLARTLDLELVLTPRRVLPAVQSLTGGSRSQTTVQSSVRGTPVRVLRQIQKQLVALERAHTATAELTSAKAAVQALMDVGPRLDVSTFLPLRRVVRWLALARVNKAPAQPLLAKAVAQLLELRRGLSATVRHDQSPEHQRAAYSLEDEIS